jgi:hypothetical protein
VNTVGCGEVAAEHPIEARPAPASASTTLNCCARLFRMTFLCPFMRFRRRHERPLPRPIRVDYPNRSPKGRVIDRIATNLGFRALCHGPIKARLPAEGKAAARRPQRVKGRWAWVVSS